MNTKDITGNRFLSFSLGEEEFGIPLLDVKEVIGMPEFTPIPFSPPHFLGIMNLRGQVISVIDFRIKLGIKPKAAEDTAVIICDLNSLSLGIVVDSINSVLSPTDDQLSDKPDVQSSKGSEYITQVFRKDDKLVLLLNIAAALGVEDIATVEKAHKKAA